MNKTKKKLLREIEEQPSFQGLDPTIAQGTNQPQNISLDAKVDRFLIQYEKESAPAVEPNNPPVVKTEGVKGLKSFKQFLFEAEGDDPPGGGDPFGGGGPDSGSSNDGPDLGDLGGGDDSGPDSGEGQPQELVPVPQININTLAPKLARLVNNYQILLDPKNTILRRIHAFILKNYDANVANELMYLLSKNFQLTIQDPVKQNTSAALPIGVGGSVGDLTANPSSSGGPAADS